jgi:hypothetical protein
MASKTYKHEIDWKKTFQNKGSTSHFSHKPDIPVRSFLDLHMVLNKYIRCCCQSKQYRGHMRTLELVKEDMDRNLDIIVLMRRIRAHGTCLEFLLSKGDRNLMS